MLRLRGWRLLLSEGVGKQWKIGTIAGDVPERGEGQMTASVGLSSGYAD